MTTDRDLRTPQERYKATPRPFEFIRIRVYRGGQAEWLKDLLEDERDSLLEDLGKLRADHDPDDPKVLDLEQDIRHANLTLRDLLNGFIDLVGEDYLGSNS